MTRTCSGTLPVFTEPGMTKEQLLPKKKGLARNARGAASRGEPQGRVPRAGALDSPSPELCRSAVASPPLAKTNVDGGAPLTWHLCWILVSSVLVQSEETGKPAHA